MDNIQLGVSLILIAATIPLLASVAIALMPRSRVKSVDDYFLFSRKLDLDSFLKTSVGYSLQVASIFLFFYWTFLYGIRALIVPIAWGVGYYLLGWAVKRGHLDAFLKIGRPDDVVTTIHGFVGTRTGQNFSRARWAVYALALSTIIGLGGTMMVEIDYATKYLMDGVGIERSDLANTSVHIVVLGFTALYVLWGGYRAVVLTDRLQVPAAYFAFGLLFFGLALLYSKAFAMLPASLLVWSVILFLTILLNRLRVLGDDRANRYTATWLFVSLMALAVYTLIALMPFHLDWSPNKALLFPETKSMTGFGVWGLISLIVANGLWQFIDISSLQRLQSLHMTERDAEKERVWIARGLTATGIEAAAGWVFIVLVALMLKGTMSRSQLKVKPVAGIIMRPFSFEQERAASHG